MKTFTKLVENFLQGNGVIEQVKKYSIVIKFNENIELPKLHKSFTNFIGKGNLLTNNFTFDYTKAESKNYITLYRGVFVTSM